LKQSEWGSAEIVAASQREFIKGEKGKRDGLNWGGVPTVTREVLSKRKTVREEDFRGSGGIWRPVGKRDLNIDL